MVLFSLLSFSLLLFDCGLDAFNHGCTILKTNLSFK